MASSPAGEHIDVGKLSFEQLTQIKVELQSEIESIRESIQTLYNCKSKYATSKEALDQVQPDWQDKQILVPLTSSMYVPGTIKEMNNFVIDVGTGYYIEKDLEGSKDYFTRRVEFVHNQIKLIEKIQFEKSKFLHLIVDLLEQRQPTAKSAA